MSNERQGGRPGAQKGTAIIPASQSVSAFLERNKSQILKVIPRHMDGERLLRVGISCIARSQQLQQATTESLVRGIVASAVLGLELDVNGEAYLLPFKNGGLSVQMGRAVYEATFVPGYKGYIKLARQSKEVESIHSGIVYEGDSFDYEQGDRAFVKHKRKLRDADAGENLGIPIAWYAALRTRGAQYPQVHVSDRLEVAQARARSRAKDSGPWVTDFAAMGLKTCIRRAAKTWPTGLNPNLTRAMAADDRSEEGVEGLGDLFPELDAIDVTPALEQRQRAPGASVGTAEKVAEKLGVTGQGGAPADDVPFETESEEKARKEREAKPGGREPGQEG